MGVGAMVHARVGLVVYGATEPKAGALQSMTNGTNCPVSSPTDDARWSVESESAIYSARSSRIVRSPAAIRAGAERGPAGLRACRLEDTDSGSIETAVEKRSALYFTSFAARATSCKEPSNTVVNARRRTNRPGRRVRAGGSAPSGAIASTSIHRRPPAARSRAPHHRARASPRAASSRSAAESRPPAQKSSVSPQPQRRWIPAAALVQVRRPGADQPRSRQAVVLEHLTAAEPLQHPRTRASGVAAIRRSGIFEHGATGPDWARAARASGGP